MKKQIIVMTAIVLGLAACGEGPEVTSKAVVEAMKANQGTSAAPVEAMESKAEPAMESASAPETQVSADGAALFAPCASCHGANGEKEALSVSAVIAGQSKDDLIMKIKGYQDGSYGGQMKASMAPMVSSLNDEQIAAVAEYIAGL